MGNYEAPSGATSHEDLDPWSLDPGSQSPADVQCCRSARTVDPAASGLSIALGHLRPSRGPYELIDRKVDPPEAQPGVVDLPEDSADTWDRVVPHAGGHEVLCTGGRAITKNQ